MVENWVNGGEGVVIVPVLDRGVEVMIGSD